MRDISARGLDSYIGVESAGTHVFKPGHRPDKRAQQVAKKNGISIERFKASAIEPEDFHRHDYIIAMDRENLRSLQAICPEEQAGNLLLIMDYAPEAGLRDVPDPYFGNLSGFERVLELLDVACKGLLNHICNQHNLS